MSDNLDMTPHLTLTPEADAAAAAAPAAPEAPTLTLDPGAAAQEAAPVQGESVLSEEERQKQRDANAVKLDESMLTEAERKMVDEFAQKIDVTDSSVVLQYGAAAQKNIASFSENALNSVRTKDLGEVGEALSSLVVELKGFGQEEDEGGIFGFFKKKRDKLEAMKASYAKAEVNVDKIVRALENHQVVLMKDIAMLDQMYELNTKYYKELTMYIIAGKKRLEYLRTHDLEDLKQKAAKSGSQEDAQAYNDFANLCSRFEKKIHDLELTRMISVQMGPQTRLLQNNDTLMLEKIQSSLVNTIPLWKSQMVLALGLEHSRQATQAQSAVTEMTNQLLQKNADMLKIGTVETAREAERSIVDIKTLQHTNEQLISTLDEVMKIQNEGSQKRKEAEVELGRIEGELKQKLLELRG
ncbi:toxic anion resistance protein [Pseudoflavonifractor sp. An184]|uniref:toxic anion resistance protein n=1 Tax=Pseudoflavonifractor sp. An184 TaxID=1965576 RepID=UPI000B39C070|nr:toxic anion resistance protein [Pseudoflavonifractor sp. An184]OUP56380.1 toxic anion resistance protein [Pseudoflavonifractor sp. An184]